MPSLSDYTKHLKKEKKQMQDFLYTAGLNTQASDTFTELSGEVLDNVGTHLCVFAQPEEPDSKYGLWFKTAEKQTIAGIQPEEKLQISNVWLSTSGLLQINSQMPNTRVVCGDYLYGFSTNKVVRAPLNNLAVLENLPLPADNGLGGTLTLQNGRSAHQPITEYNGKIYIVANSSTTTTAVYNDVVSYDPETQTYTYINSVQADGTAVAPTAIIGANNKLYLFGGGSNTTKYQSLYWVIDLSDNSISVPMNSPQKRYNKGGLVLYEDRYIYMFHSGYNPGGGSPVYPVVSAAVHRFDTEDNTWEQLSNSPISGNGDNVYPILCNDKIYFFGCRSNINNDGKGREAWVYNVTTDTYTRLPDMPAEMWAVRAIYDEAKEQLIVSGGWDPWSNVLNATYYFDIKENVNQPHNTIVLHNCLPNRTHHHINFYQNSKLDTANFGTYFRKAYLWDNVNNAPYNVEVYKGDGEKWSKI